MTQNKSLAATIFSFFASLGLPMVLQLIVLTLGVIAGFYSIKKTRAEFRLAQMKIDKLNGANIDE